MCFLYHWLRFSFLCFNHGARTSTLESSKALVIGSTWLEPFFIRRRSRDWVSIHTKYAYKFAPSHRNLAKTQKTENSSLHGFELRRPSSKSNKVLLQTLKAIWLSVSSLDMSFSDASTTLRCFRNDTSYLQDSLARSIKLATTIIHCHPDNASTTRSLMPVINLRSMLLRIRGQLKIRSTSRHS